MMMIMMMMWGAKRRWGNDTSDHQINSFSQDEEQGTKSHILTSRPEGLPPKSRGWEGP